jgi:low affinity Fe/Cu permease
MIIYTQRVFARLTFMAVLVVFVFIFTGCGNLTPMAEKFDIGNVSLIKDVS